MTETPVLEQDLAADALDPVISGLESILRRLRKARGLGGSPVLLKYRAAEVRAAENSLALLHLDLVQEALECDAEATAITAAEEAAEALDRAAAVVADAEAAYDATSEPQRVAISRATDARHGYDRTADSLGQAEQDNSEAAVLADLHGRVRDAQAVLEHEAGKLRGAQQGRQDAKDALDRARGAHREAQDTHRAAKATAASPDPGSLPLGEVAEALMLSWPAAFYTEDPPDVVIASARYHCTRICDSQGWIPPGTETRIKQEIAREMAATARRGRAVEISDGQGTLRLVPSPLGMMGASQVATVAQAR